MAEEQAKKSLQSILSTNKSNSSETPTRTSAPTKNPTVNHILQQAKNSR